MNKNRPTPHALPPFKVRALRDALCSFPRAAVKSTTNLVAKNSRNAFPHSCGGQTAEIKVSAGLVPSEGSDGELIPCSLLASDGCWQA